ncbi:MAG: flippase-like domain-containing protein [Thermomicrobiales bacterium]|nr:flippase-like domain-containing protein [Thermomicrobiales bacterium]
MSNLNPGAESSVEDASLELELERESEPRDIGSSLLTPRTAISFLLALVVFYFVIRRTNLDLGEALRQIRQANFFYFLGALAAYYFTFVIRGWRWSKMLASAGISEETGHDMPDTVGMFEIFTLSWFVNSILPARMGDAYRCYLIKRRANASFGISLGTMLAERLVDLVVLVLMLLVAGIAVYGTHAPDRAENAFLVGGVVVVIGVTGVVVLWLLRNRIEGFLPAKIARVYARVRNGLFDSLAQPRTPVLVSVGIWLCDGLRVFLVAWALGQHISYQAAIMVALLSALVSTVPITPAGLGFVEGIMIYALTTIGVPNSTAGAIALLDRVVTYGSLLIVGGIMYLWVLRKDLRAIDARPD